MCVRRIVEERAKVFLFAENCCWILARYLYVHDSPSHYAMAFTRDVFVRHEELEMIMLDV